MFMGELPLPGPDTRAVCREAGGQTGRRRPETPATCLFLRGKNKPFFFFNEVWAEGLIFFQIPHLPKLSALRILEGAPAPLSSDALWSAQGSWVPGSGGGTGLRRAAGQHGCPAVPGPGHQAAASCWPSSRSPELLRRCNPPPVAGATVRTALPTHLARGSNSVPQAPACPPPLQAAPPRWEAHTEGSLPRCPRSPAVQRPASRVHAATGSRPHSPLATHRRTALASLARRPPNRAPSARRRDWGVPHTGRSPLLPVTVVYPPAGRQALGPGRRHPLGSGGLPGVCHHRPLPARRPPSSGWLCRGRVQAHSAATSQLSCLSSPPDPPWHRVGCS